MVSQKWQFDGIFAALQVCLNLVVKLGTLIIILRRFYEKLLFSRHNH